MKKILTILMFVTALVGGVQAQNNYFVSSSPQPPNSGARDGQTWQTAYATIDAAVTAATTAGGSATYNIYVAKGTYTMQQHNLNGAYTINLYGGYPVPDEDTPPNDVCNHNMSTNETELGNTTLTESVFRLKGDGGGLSIHRFVYNSTAPGTIGDGSFITLDGDQSPEDTPSANDCRNKTLTLKEFVIKDYRATSAGFIYPFNVEGADINLENVIVEQGGNGGGLTPLGGSFITVRGTGLPECKDIDINVKQCAFSNVVVSGLDGAALISMDMSGNKDKGSSSLLVDNSTFCENHNVSYNLATAASMVYSSNLYINSLRTMHIANSQFTHCYGSGGGAIFLLNSNLTVTDSKFNNNEAYSYQGGGAIYTKGEYIGTGEAGTGSVGAFTEKVLITNSYFYDNKTYTSVESTDGGGAIHIDGSLEMKISGSHFYNNETKVSGGAIKTRSAKQLEIVNSTFCDNESINTNGGAVTAADGANVYSHNNYYGGNKADDNGGAMYFGDNTTVTITNDLFENNKTTNDDGGALEIRDNVSITNARFYNNTAGDKGGAISFYRALAGSSDVTITNTEFETNTATGKGGAITVGGPMGDTKLTIYSSLLKGNTATSDGGAIYYASVVGAGVTLQDSYFISNHSTNGSGGALFDDATTSETNVFSGNTFDGNTANFSGGAIYTESPSVTSTNDVFMNNTATDDGGAIRMKTINSNLTTNGTMFYNNSAKNGGALRLYGKSTITNTSFLNNSATSTGGAIYTQDTGQTGDGDAVTFSGSKSHGNTANGETTTINSSEFYLPNAAGLFHVNMDLNDNSQVQFAVNNTNYRTGSFGTGYKRTSATQSNSSTITAPTASSWTALSFTNTACPAKVPVVCYTAQDIIPPYPGIVIGTDVNGTETNKTICYSEISTTQITMFGSYGTAPYSIKYKIKTINGADASTSETAVLTQNNLTASGTTLNIPSTVYTEGATHIYVILDITDANNKVTDYSACGGAEMLRIHINPQPKLTATTPVSLCAGSNVDLDATFTATNTLTTALEDAGAHWNNSTTPTWSWSGGTIVSGGNTATPTVSAGGTYTVTVTDNNGCTNTANVEVTVNPLPTSNYTINNIVVCSGDTDGKFTLSGSETGVNYQLQTAAGVNVGSAVAGTGASIELPLGGTITATTTYKVLATNATTLCSVELTTQPTAYLIKDYNGLGLTADNMMCPNKPFTLTGEAATATGANSIVYAWASSTTSATADFTTIAGATDKDYTESAGISQTTWYKRIVHFKNTNAPGIECVQETVKEVKINDFAASITSSAATICSGQTATITIRLSGGLAPWKVLYANGDPVSANSNQIYDTDGTADNSFDFTFATKVLTATTVFNTNNIKVYDHNYCEKTLSGSVTITVNKCVDAKDDITQTPQGVAVSGNVITNDSGAGLSLTNINIGGTDYPVTSTSTATAIIPGVGTIVIDKDGNYTFTPDANYAGGHVPYITYTVKDTNGNTDTARLKINVIPDSGNNNNGPIANNDNMRVSSDATSPTTTNILVNDSDPDGDLLKVSWCGVGGDYTDINGATLTPPIGTPTDIYEMQNGARVKVGTLTVKKGGDASFVPANGFVGSIPVNYTASDGTASQEATLTIESLPVDQAPAVDANDDLKAAYMGKIISINPLANDNIVKGGGTLAVKTVDIPNADGSSFTTVSLPSAGTASYPIEGKGTIVVHSDGSVDFVPLNGFVGSVVLPYTATNGLSGGSEATDKANMVFTSLNTVEAKDDITQTPQNVAVSGDVTLNDTGKESTVKLTKINIGPNEFDFSSSVTSITQNISRAGEVIGSITIADNGKYTFTPATDKVGKVPDISYTVTTPGGLTSSANLKINVIPTTAPGNNPPVVNDDIAETEDDTPITVNLLANDSDPDGDALSVASATGLDASGSAINISSNSSSPTTVYDANGNEAGTAYFDANGKIVFAPKKGFTGNVPFEYTATDGTLSNTGKVNIRVVPAGSTNGVYAVDDAVVGPAGSAMSVYPVDNDSNTNGGAALSVKSITIGDETIALPTSGSVERTIAGKGKIIFNSDGSVSFTPEAGFIGTYDVPYVATNGVATDAAVIHFTSVKSKSCGFLRSNRNVTRQLKP